MSTVKELSKVEQIVVNNLLEAIESKKELPWTKPWATIGGGLPYNYDTGHTYSGFNLITLMFFADTPEWLTAKAISKRGGSIKKGHKGVPLIRPNISYYLDGKRISEKEFKALPDGKKKDVFKRVTFSYYKVWNVENDTTGITIERPEQPVFDVKQKAECESLINAFGKECKINIHESNRAYYQPSTDSIVLPLREQFKKTENFYSVAFHEMVHATGHPSRLDRELKGKMERESYAKEELIAEIGAAILNATYGTFAQIESNHQAYVQSWLKALKNNPRMIIEASRQSSKAVKYLLATVGN